MLITVEALAAPTDHQRARILTALTETAATVLGPGRFRVTIRQDPSGHSAEAERQAAVAAASWTGC
ncbi:hypothetical protein [Nonomuraea sp. NPDC049709]|uniref:hypothetical protein n=1 Tax=Nonomuraea sp. NPDC049709 TaxID=3154736 RepID=UPI0034251FAB